jgi:cytochrome c oxidase subunit 3
MKKSIKEKALKQLLWVGIVSISMFFAGLTSAFIVRKAEGNWTEFILPDWFIASTFVIILSSVLLFFVRGRLKKGKSVFNLLFTTLLLGIIFSYLQFEGWGQLTNQGIYLTGVGSNVAGSFLYVLTLSHLVHLAGGVVALVFASVKSKLNLYSADNCLGLDLTMMYWHFLAVLWLYLFIFLKFL